MAAVVTAPRRPVTMTPQRQSLLPSPDVRGKPATDAELIRTHSAGSVAGGGSLQLSIDSPRSDIKKRREKRRKREKQRGRDRATERDKKVNTAAEYEREHEEKDKRALKRKDNKAAVDRADLLQSLLAANTHCGR